MKRGFSLIEVLVVTAIIALLLGLLLPVTGRARLQAKVLTVNAELKGIGMALEAYSFDHEGRYPPVRVDCMLGGHFYQLPYELTDEGYLPKPPPGTFLSAGIQDRFNPGYTYKYRSVGTLIYNRTTMMEEGAFLWVPDGFPDHEQQLGRTYSNLKDSPVSWVLYSQGPNFDDRRMKEMQYPVPRATWLNGQRTRGIIVRMRLQNGRQLGSLEG
ncbi:MAG: type II secretion system GspH family protein [Planctomycetes bacterium]|jgi:prepilin-type N-terminal cleavage/methylation domain-containing protein|nr:type II secretion system GspH family protein [Planctomycetota bacterium]